MPLHKCIKKNRYKVVKAPEIYLLSILGVREGIIFEVQSIHPLGGPVVVKVGNRSIAIARDVAEDILVKEVC